MGRESRVVISSVLNRVHPVLPLLHSPMWRVGCSQLQGAAAMSKGEGSDAEFDPFAPCPCIFDCDSNLNQLFIHVEHMITVHWTCCPQRIFVDALVKALIVYVHGLFVHNLWTTHLSAQFRGCGQKTKAAQNKTKHNAQPGAKQNDLCDDSELNSTPPGCRQAPQPAELIAHSE